MQLNLIFHDMLLQFQRSLLFSTLLIRITDTQHMVRYGNSTWMPSMDVEPVGWDILDFRCHRWRLRNLKTRRGLNKRNSKQFVNHSGKTPNYSKQVARHCCGFLIVKFIDTVIRACKYSNFPILFKSSNMGRKERNI